MTVQRYNPGGTVDSSAMPGPKFSPSATAASFGGTLARQVENAGDAMQNAGRTIAQNAAASAEKVDRAIARDAVNQAHQEALEFSHGLYAKEGKDAIDSYGQGKKGLTEIRDKYLKTLKTDGQKELFDAAFGSTANQHLESIYSHQEKQRKLYEENTLDADNKIAQDMAISSRNNPAAISASAETIKQNIAYKYASMGETVVKVKTMEAMHALNSDIAEAYANSGDIKGALEYVNANRDGFNPAKLPEFEAKLLKQNEVGWIQAKAKEIVDSGTDLDAQLTMADKVAGESKDPEIAGRLRDAVKERYNDQKNYYEAKRKMFVESEMDKMVQDPVNYRPPQGLTAKEFEDLSALNKKFNPIFKAEAFRKFGVKAGVGTGKNPTLYNELVTLSPEELAVKDLGEVAGQLSLEEWKSVRDMQSIARKPDNDPKKQELYKTRSVREQAKAAVYGMPDLDAKRGEAEKTRLDRFWDQFEQQLNLIPQDQRTAENIGKLLKGLKEPVTSKGAKYRFEIPYLSSTDRMKQINDSGLAYDGIKTIPTDDGGYVVEQGDVRVIYDKAGKKVKTQKRVTNAA